MDDRLVEASLLETDHPHVEVGEPVGGREFEGAPASVRRFAEAAQQAQQIAQRRMLLDRRGIEVGRLAETFLGAFERRVVTSMRPRLPIAAASPGAAATARSTARIASLARPSWKSAMPLRCSAAASLGRCFRTALQWARAGLKRPDQKLV